MVALGSDQRGHVVLLERVLRRSARVERTGPARALQQSVFRNRVPIRIRLRTRYLVSHGITHDTLTVVVFVADIRHTDSKDGLARIGGELCGMRNDAASMRPFAVTDLFRPDGRMHLKAIAKQILLIVSR